MTDNTRKIGAFWEKQVAEYLEMEGMEILDMNYRTRYSEIDIIARDKEEIVFIEVKYRTSSFSGNPLEAVDSKKQNRIRNAALYYLSDHNYIEDRTSIRFDVIGIEGQNIEHIKMAF
ncbi:MAG: YraN family protein [Eubacterium sp.]|nr:YraN family protein [Eubacterium sp.]